MHRAVRIHAHQQMPNYRKPSSFLIKESYPLPPYSSIIGMIHAVCGWKSYLPMRVSIQGSYASRVSDYATNYVFGIAYDPTRHQRKVSVGDGKYDGITVGPKNYELLTDVELILHIMPEDDALIEEVYTALDNPPIYPSLGRYEDLLQIEELDIVELVLPEDGGITNRDIYIPVTASDDDNLIGTVYRLNKKYKLIKNGQKTMRRWTESVIARYVCKDNFVLLPNMYIDKTYGDMVFPA